MPVTTAQRIVQEDLADFIIFSMGPLGLSKARQLSFNLDKFFGGVS